MKPTISMGVGPLRAAVPASLLAKIGTLLRGPALARCAGCGGGGQHTAIRIVIIFARSGSSAPGNWFGLYDPVLDLLWAVVVFGPFLGSLLSALGSKPRFKVEPRIAGAPRLFPQAALSDLAALYIPL